MARARQLKAQSVQRSLEEVSVRQIEIEKESVEIGMNDFKVIGCIF